MNKKNPMKPAKLEKFKNVTANQQKQKNHSQEMTVKVVCETGELFLPG